MEEQPALKLADLFHCFDANDLHFGVCAIMGFKLIDDEYVVVYEFLEVLGKETEERFDHELFIYQNQLAWHEPGEWHCHTDEYAFGDELDDLFGPSAFGDLP